MRYILEYEIFLNEKVNNNVDLQKFINDNFDHKVSLSKYGLLQLKTFRLNGYKKIVNDANAKSNKLKEGYNHSKIYEYIENLDNDYDNFFYVISEFRKTIQLYESTKRETAIKDGRLHKYMNSKELIKFLHTTLDNNEFKNVIFDGDKQPEGSDYAEALGSYTFSPKHEITIYFDNVFPGNSFEDFIYSDEKEFTKILQTISVTFFHETIHFLQDVLDPQNLINTWRKSEKHSNAMVRLNLWNKEHKYYADEFEIHAHAHDTVKQLYSVDGYSLDDILKIIKDPDRYKRLVPASLEVYNRLFSKNYPQVYNTFVNALEEIVTKRKQLE